MSNKQPATLAPAPQSKFGASLLCAITVFVVTVFTAISDYPTQKLFGLLGAIALILFFAMSGAERLHRMKTPLAFAALAYVGWSGVSTLYARSGKFAIAEFSCLLAAFMVYAAIVLFAGKDENGFRRVAAGLAAAAAPIGILSIDAASLNLLMRPFRAILSLTAGGYDELGSLFYSRLQTIFGNPNTYAGLMSIACLLSLYLVLSAQSRRQKILSTVLLMINAVSYLLAFSMGSLGVFVVACLLLLALCPGADKRIDCLLLLVQTAVVALIVSMIAVRGFGETATGSPLPLLMLAIGCAAAVLLEVFVRGKIVTALAGRGKAMLIAGGAVAVAIVAYLIIGLQIAGPYTFGQTASFLRATDLPAGDYTLNVTASGPVTVEVYYKTTSNLVQNNQTDLLSADAAQPISFSIPKDSRLVFFRFSSAEPGTVVESAAYTGASEGAVKLNYKLLPAFIADRVQDLSANGNVVQRQVYLQDALRLFKTSPVIGRGLGGFQNGIVSVQDYYYETKYAHNHYVEMLCDLGIIGLIAFLALLVCALWSLLKSRKSKPAIVAVLAACMLQMFGQAWTDLTWSVGVCMSMFFGVLGLISVYCGDALLIPAPKGKKPTALRASVVAYSAVFAVLIGLNLIAQSRLHGGNLTLDTLKSNASIDFFETNDHKLSYLLSGGTEHDAETAERFADDLSHVQSNSIGIPLAQYYMQTVQFDKALDVLDNASDYMRADAEVWQQLFTLYEQMLDPTKGEYNAVQLLQNKERFTDRMKATYDKLVTVNADQLDNVLLTAQNNTFVSKLLAAYALPEGDILNTLLVFETLMIDTKTAPDVDGDGAPDYAKTTEGQVTWHGDGSFTAEQDSVIELTATAAYEGEYYLTVTGGVSGVTGASQGDQPFTLDPATGRSTETIRLLGGDIEKTIILRVKQGTTVDRVQYTRVKPDSTT